jgi:hypothetical protein
VDELGSRKIDATELALMLASEFPQHTVRVINPNLELLELCRAGQEDFELWAGSWKFQSVVHHHGTLEEKLRLSVLNVGYACDGNGNWVVRG